VDQWIIQEPVRPEGLPIGCARMSCWFPACRKKRNLQEKTQGVSTPGWVEISFGHQIIEPSGVKNPEMGEAKVE